VNDNNLNLIMGCCQSESLSQSQFQHDFKTEIVGYEKREENGHNTLNDAGLYSGAGAGAAGGLVVGGNMFEDNFYIDSVERYHVKYRPPNTSGVNGN
jgi:hypothetical protein